MNYLERLKARCMGGLVATAAAKVTVTAVDYWICNPQNASRALYWAFRAQPATWKTEVEGYLTYWFSNRGATGSLNQRYIRADTLVSQPTLTGYPSNFEEDTGGNIGLWYALLGLYIDQYGISFFSDAFKTGAHEPLLAVHKLYNPDGLTWTKTATRNKRLVGNVELWAGLSAAARILPRLNPGLGAHMGGLAGYLADQTATGLKTYFSHTSQLWSAQKSEAGVLNTGIITDQVWPYLFGMGAVGGVRQIERQQPRWRKQRYQKGGATTDIHCALAAAAEGQDVSEWMRYVAPYLDNDLGAAELGMIHFIDTKCRAFLPKATQEPPLEPGATRWSFDTMHTDWDLANQGGELVDQSSIVQDYDTQNGRALKIWTAQGSTERKKRRSALRYGAGRYRWRAFIPALSDNDRVSIGSWLYNDDTHELDFEVCHGKELDRKKYGAQGDEVLAWCTNQDGPYFSQPHLIKRNAWHIFEIDVKLVKPAAAWVYEVTWRIDGISIKTLVLEFGQNKPFKIYCSVENLTFTGDQLPTKDNFGLWDWVEYKPYEGSITPAP